MAEEKKETKAVEPKKEEKKETPKKEEAAKEEKKVEEKKTEVKKEEPKKEEPKKTEVKKEEPKKEEKIEKKETKEPEVIYVEGKRIYTYPNEGPSFIFHGHVKPVESVGEYTRVEYVRPGCGVAVGYMDAKDVK